MTTIKSAWHSSDFCLSLQAIDASDLAPTIYDRVCRTDFQAPGFCAINVGPNYGSAECHDLMLRIAAELSDIHFARMNQKLAAVSSMQFDQQVSTRPHLDSGPPENLLLLGYEPSEVDSILEVFDYSRCAHDNSLTPAEFLKLHNPMFQQGYKMLLPYVTRIDCFSPQDYVLVCLNNSLATLDSNGQRWQGVLHSAIVQNPNPAQARKIRSMMIAPKDPGTVNAPLK